MSVAGGVAEATINITAIAANRSINYLLKFKL